MSSSDRLTREQVEQYAETITARDPTAAVAYDAPVILVEVGTEPEGLPRPVITKEDSITCVSLDWEAEMDLDLIDRALAVLRPLRDDHPRFAITVDRLELRRQKANDLDGKGPVDEYTVDEYHVHTTAELEQALERSTEHEVDDVDRLPCCHTCGRIVYWHETRRRWEHASPPERPD